MTGTSTSDLLVLAVDVGTSSARCGLYDARGDLAPGTLRSEEHGLRTTPDGGAELDADSLVERVCDLIGASVSSAGGRTIVGVGTTTFWHSLMGVDEHGDAATPVYTWADTRAVGAARDLHSLLDVESLCARTGRPVHPSYLLEKLLWLRHDRPELFSQVRTWMSFGEYLHLRLLGETRCAAGMASATGLYDQARAEWYAPALEVARVSADDFAPLVSLSEPLGVVRASFASRWPGLKGTPWFPAVGDGACSNIGSGAGSPGKAALNFGTSGAIRTVVREPVSFPRGLWLYRIDESRLLLGGALSNAGNIYGWLLDTLRLSSEEAERALVESEPGTTGLRFIPHLAGERSPGWTIEATGEVSGLRLDTSREELLRAGMEGVLADFLTVHRRLREAAGDLGELIAGGGAVSHSGVTRQLVADALGVPLRVCAEEEPSARGAALLTLESLGVIEDASDVHTDLSETYAPDPARHAAYAAIELERRSGGTVG